MNYKLTILISLYLFLISCEQSTVTKPKKINFEKYSNSGFTLVYTNDLKNIKELEPRSLKIYHKSLKKKSIIKIAI